MHGRDDHENGEFADHDFRSSHDTGYTGPGRKEPHEDCEDHSRLFEFMASKEKMARNGCTANHEYRNTKSTIGKEARLYFLPYVRLVKLIRLLPRPSSGSSP